jgi:glycosyltransferase involved in cell wall biosynthesis
LNSCVTSAISQEGVDVNVLIIDDCSSDNSIDICRELKSADQRISFIDHEVNRGRIATYNEGLMLASSDYLVLLSADDLLTPGALRRATDLTDRNPSVGLVYEHPSLSRRSAVNLKDRSNVYPVEDFEADFQVHMRVGSG